MGMAVTQLSLMPGSGLLVGRIGLSFVESIPLVCFSAVCEWVLRKMFVKREVENRIL